MKWFSNPQDTKGEALEVLPNENIPWWERKEEFDKAKKVLVGIKVRFPGQIHRDSNEIGTIRKVFIQQPIFDHRVGKINAKIIAIVDFDRGCSGVNIKNLVPVDQLKIDSNFLLGEVGK